MSRTWKCMNNKKPKSNEGLECNCERELRNSNIKFKSDGGIVSKFLLLKWEKR